MRPTEASKADGHALAGQLLTETREELARADGKAQILLAVSGVAVSVVLGGAISGDWSPSDLDRCAQVLWWIGVSAAALGLSGLGYAVFPRLLTADDARITYFEDVLRYKDCPALSQGLAAEAARGDRDVEQLLRLSRLAHRKYLAIQASMSALLAAAVICAVAALAG
jgi:hypothetical protein